MDVKAFLNYLLQSNQLTQEQIVHCVNLSETNSQTLPQILCQQGHFTEETLNQSVTQFQSISTPKQEQDLLGEIEQYAILASNPIQGVSKASVPQTYIASPPSKSSETEDIQSNPSNPLPSTQLGEERYEVLNTLGAGGMGVVQLVKDRILDREVALKRIRRGQKKSQKPSTQQSMMLFRLQREASITAILEHPNIVPLYDLQHSQEGDVYFTMRKVKGETFSQILKKVREGGNEYTENRLLSIYLKVCEAVAYAHAEGVVHRDLKPDNIMVGKFGEVYVMDWGIAKKLNEMETTSPKVTSILKEEIDPLLLEKTRVPLRQNSSPLKGNESSSTFSLDYHTIGGMGTMGYMSPEQAENASLVTAKADIYALGKILRECFTYHSSTEELRLQIQKGTNLKGGSDPFREKIPSDVQAIIQKATKENCLERYHSVEELVKDLESYRQNLRVSVREYGMLELLLKWIQRNRQRIVFVGLFVSLLFCVLGYSVWKIQRVKQFNEQKARLARWLDKFKQGQILAGENEDFIFEVSKMEEEALCEELIKELEKGVQTIEKRSVQKPNEILMVESIAKVLGRIGNKSVTQFLRSSLVRIDQVVSKLPKNERKTEDIALMSAIGNALGNLNDFEFSTQFRMIRYGYQNELFWNRTELASKKLLEGSLQYWDQKIRFDPKNSEFYRQRALAKSEKGDFKEAIEDCTHAIRLNPQSAEGYTTRGFAKYANSDFNGAIDDFTEAIRFNPQDAVAYNNRGNAKEENGDFNGAIDDFTEAIRFNPQNAEAYNNRGIAYQKKGDFTEAINNFTRAIQMNPQFAGAYMSRGNANQKNNNFEGAINDFTQAIQLNPQYVDAYLSRGNAKQLKGNFEGAIDDFTQAIQLNPQDANAYNTRGVAKQLKGNFEGALDDFTQAIQLNPQDANTYNTRGVARHKNGDFEGALDDFTRAIQMNPQYIDAYISRGLAKEENGDFNGAIDDFTRVIQINPQYADVYISRGITKHTKGDVEGSINDFTEAIRLNPQYVLAYYNRGLAKQAKSDFEGALDDFTRTIQLNSHYTNAYYNRGLVKQTQSDFEGSINDFTEAIRLNPQDATAYNNRGVSKKKKRDFDEAIDDYNEAIRLNPQYADAYINRGLAKQEKNEINGAIDDYEKALSLQDYPKIYKRLTTLLETKFSQEFRRKEYQKAKETLIRLKPYLPDSEKSQVDKKLEALEKQIQQEK